MGVTVTNPGNGYTYGTAEDDSFTITDRSTDWRQIEAGEGFDRLVINHSFVSRSSIRIEDFFGHGNFDGRASDGPYGPWIGFENVEDVSITGSQGDDDFQLTIRPSSAGLLVALDGNGGTDLLKFDFSRFLQPVTFLASATEITSSYGSFANFERFEIYAGAGDDVIRTLDGDDTLHGGAGANILEGGGGNDRFYSVSVTDRSDGGEGTDSWQANYSEVSTALSIAIGEDVRISEAAVATNMESVSAGGGTGNDVITVTRTGTVIVYGGGGNDTLVSDLVAEKKETFLVSSAASGQLNGSASEMSFYQIEKVVFRAGASDDEFRLLGEFGADQIDFDGGLGFDRLTADFKLLAGGSTFIVGADGAIQSNRGQFKNFEVFTITGGAGADHIVGGVGDDHLIGGGGADVISGGGGNDQIDVLFGATSYSGDAGNDSLRLTGLSSGLADAIVNGGDGIDTLDARGVSAGSNQYLYFTDASFSGLSGAQGSFHVGDYLVSGVEIIWGGFGQNWFLLQEMQASITIHGNQRADWFATSFGHSDVMYGYGGDDFFQVRPGDQAFGGSGNDVFELNYSGTGTARGEAGFDTLKLGFGWTVDLQAGVANGPISGSAYTISSIENVSVYAWRGYQTSVYGSTQSNVFSVDPAFDDGSIGVVFDGRGGDDELSGSGGVDTLNGGTGSDLLNGRSGNDQLDGGEGMDTAVFSGARSDYTIVNLGDGRVRVTGPDGTDTLARVEQLQFDAQLYAVPTAIFEQGLSQAVANFGAGEAGGGWASFGAYPRAVGDVNGDGRADIVGFGEAGTYVSLANANGTFGAVTQVNSQFGRSDAAGGWASQNSYARMLADINGDGRDDLIGFGEVGVYAAFADGTGGFGAVTQVYNQFGRGEAGGGWENGDNYPRTLADVNGDGRADLVSFGENGTFVALADGAGGFGPLIQASNQFGRAVAAGGWASQDQYARMLGDVNGDGRADIVAFGEAATYLALGNADGTFGGLNLLVEQFGRGAAGGGWESQERFPRAVADVNGDGLADIIGFGDAGVYYALADGQGGVGPVTLGIAQFGPSAGGWASNERYPRMLADVNGDGLADIVGFGENGVFVTLADGLDLVTGQSAAGGESVASESMALDMDWLLMMVDAAEPTNGDHAVTEESEAGFVSLNMNGRSDGRAAFVEPGLDDGGSGFVFFPLGTLEELSSCFVP